MKYYLFLDESGDHGLGEIDHSFPVFVLCGIICPSDAYDEIMRQMNAIKQKYWQTKNVIFHSRDIRKCEKEFQILFDMDIKRNFYADINDLILKSDYNIIASAIHKERYIKSYGRLNDDVYEISLSFIIERAGFWLDCIKSQNKELDIIIEKRGQTEDKKLARHFQKLLSRGTGYVEPGRLNAYGISISFKAKNENINGLQLSDLAAYPISRYVIDSARANPAFEVLSNKFYKQAGKRYGLKIFP